MTQDQAQTQTDKTQTDNAQTDKTQGGTTTSGYVDTDQSAEITGGMQGATGATDANGLDPEADPQEKLEELRQNMQDIQN